MHEKHGSNDRHEHQPSLAALASSVPAVPGAADIAIEPEKVLAVAKVIEDQANALQDKLRQKLGQLHIATPSADIVSVNATAAWNELVADGEHSYAKRVRTYVQNLRNLAEQLRGAAQHYQADDQRKAASFGDRHAYEV